MKSTLIYSLLSASLAAATQIPKVNGMKAIWTETFEGCGGCEPKDDWTIALDINTNNEHQKYTTSNTNIQLSGGDTLQLVPWKDERSGAWTSGRIETKESWNAQPGKSMRWQASLRMGESARRKGMWPAFWLLGDAIRHGTEWPMCGELDIFETVNGDGLGHGTVHCGQEQGGVCNETTGRAKTIAIPDNDFHTWSLVIDRTSGNWRQESIQWSMDGQAYHTLTGAEINDEGIWSTIAHSPLYAILNVAVGGDWPGEPDSSTESGYGNMMEVKYVAVYESA